LKDSSILTNKPLENTISTFQNTSQILSHSQKSFNPMSHELDIYFCPFNKWMCRFFTRF
jgi:hypothetical protein